MFESLESRRLLSVVLNGSVLNVAGSEKADVVTVAREGENVVVVENGQSHTFPAAGLSLSVDTAGGNDRVTLGDGLGLTGISVMGGDGNDVLVAGSDAVTLNGGAGNDRLTGGAGGDRLLGGDGSDRLSGGAGDDNLVGHEGHDRVSGGDGADLIYGNAGNDRIDAEGGADYLDGGPGNDVLGGGAGDDTIRDDVGRNAARGGDGADTARMVPRQSRARGVEVMEYVGVPHGDRPPTAAAISTSTTPEGIRTVTVTLTLPGPNYEVVWGELRKHPDPSLAEIGVSVSLRRIRGAAAPGAGAATATRTFEVFGIWHAHRFAVWSARGKELAVEPMLILSDPSGPEARPVGLHPDDVELGVYPSAGGVVAAAVVDHADTGGVTFGPLTRQGSEFFVDAAATGTGGAFFHQSARADFPLPLAELAPGLYAFTLRSRAGVVETMYFEVGSGR